MDTDMSEPAPALDANASNAPRGGAVLWYLRKHAPMKSDVRGTAAAADSSTPKDNNLSRRRANSGHRSARQDKVGPLSARSQRDFLHAALLAVGAELDEASSGPGHAPASRPRSRCRQSLAKDLASATALDRPLPVRSVNGVTIPSQAASLRLNLRSGFKEHADAEIDELEQRVSSREDDVASLTRQVELLEHQVTTTKMAAVRRSMRLRQQATSTTLSDPGNGATDALTQPLPGVNSFHNQIRSLIDFKKSFLAASENIDAEVAPATVTKADTISAWRRNLTVQAEQVGDMRSTIEERTRQVQKLALNRKAAETALFGAHTETLLLAARAEQTEARVTRLARELRRVYKDLPRVIGRHLAQVAETTRAEKMTEEFIALKDTNREQLFKFKSVQELQSESDAYDQYLFEVSDLIHAGHQQIKDSREAAREAAALALEARDALKLLEDATNREVQQAAMRTATEGTSSQNLGAPVSRRRSLGKLVGTLDEAQVVHEQCGLAIAAVEELLVMAQSPLQHRSVPKAQSRPLGGLTGSISKGLARHKTAETHRSNKSAETHRSNKSAETCSSGSDGLGAEE